METVEELKDKVAKFDELRTTVFYIFDKLGPSFGVDVELWHKIVDSLITAARAEGAEKAEEEKAANWAAIHKAFPNLPRGTEIDRLREKMFAGHTSSANVDALCAAVAAEGAERAKADIWKAQLYGYRVQLYPFPHDEREGLRVETEVNGKQYVMVPVASVLAPEAK